MSKSKEQNNFQILRELKKFEEAFNSDWASELKDLFKKSIAYNKEMKDSDYSTNNQRVKEYEKKLSELLKVDLSTKHKKEQAFIKRLRKRRNAIFTFLYYKEVPPDNNASEGGIRNIKP